MKTLAKETAQYVEIGRGRLYAIAFGCEHPQAKVLLCGPSPINRLYSLAAWVRWARFLVQHKIAAVRFDYRGTGESAGEFVEMSFNDWVDDVEQMSVWADSKLGKCPLVLHGMGMGGLLAEKTFSSGRGEGLLLWSALTRARDLFDQALIMRLSMDMVHTRLKKRKSAQDYMSEVKSGRPFESDGYSWSSGLWESGRELNLDPVYAKLGHGVTGNRPWRHAALSEELVPLAPSLRLQRAMHPRAAMVLDPPLNPDFNPFFEENLDWLRCRVLEARQDNNA